jgi:hypothetical protein
MKIYRIARNGGGVHEEKRNGSRGKWCFGVWPKSPFYSSIGDLGTNSL